MTTLPADELVERLVNPMSAHGLRLAAKEAAAELPALRAEVASIQKELAERTAERDALKKENHDLGNEIDALEEEGCEADDAIRAAETRADTLAQALRAIVDTLDAEEMGEGPPASEWSKHWQKLHDDARAALGDRP